MCDDDDQLTGSREDMLVYCLLQRSFIDECVKRVHSAQITGAEFVSLLVSVESLKFVCC